MINLQYKLYDGYIVAIMIVYEHVYVLQTCKYTNTLDEAI